MRSLPVTLAQRLESGPLPCDDALRVLRAVTRALSPIHARGCAHGGIDPTRIGWLGDDLDGASLLPGDADAATGAAFVAPERGSLDAPSLSGDVFSLGATLFTAIAGAPPPRPSALEPAVSLAGFAVASAALDDLVARMLAPDPDSRIPDALELEVALGAIEEGPASSSGPPRRGDLVGGRFVLDRLLGEGGMGIVWAATHVVTGQRRALKLMRAGHPSAALRERFLVEAAAATRAAHEATVVVHDVFEAEDGGPVVVMDLLEGETLRERLARERTLSSEAAAALLLPVVNALEAAHAAGVVHRDLKPENLFITSSGAIKVLDFGIAKLVSPDGAGPSGLTRSDELLGTPEYMAPEQCLGDPGIDRAADFWSLGVVAYEVLAGEKPFVGPTPARTRARVIAGDRARLRDRAPRVPVALADVVERLLTVDVDARLTDCGEVRRALRGYASRRDAGGWAVAVGATVLAVGALVGLSISSGPSAPPRSASRPEASADTGVKPKQQPTHAAVEPRPVLPGAPSSVGSAVRTPPATAASLAGAAPPRRPKASSSVTAQAAAAMPSGPPSLGSAATQSTLGIIEEPPP